MSVRSFHQVTIVALAATLGAVWGVPKAECQVIQQAIGGVQIDAHGVLSRAPKQLRKTVAELIREQLDQVPEDLAGQTELRLVSLKRIESALRDAITTGQPIDDNVRYLHGLQRVEYLLVYPELQDIVIAGRAEAWTVSPLGEVVGATSGMPVMWLDDLLLALRSTEAARTVGISCSIDPTPQGRQSLERYLAKRQRFHPSVARGMEEALGPQQITITGVPADSHFARVLVAADFQMKLIAMGLESAPINGLPSFIQLIKQGRGRVDNLMPRWWMACDYEALGKTADGLGWQIRGRGVKVMTEDDIVHADGTTTGSGRANPVAQEWASLMSDKFDQLAKVESVFGQVRNLMELSIVAALIAREDLQGLSGCALDTMSRADSPYAIETWNVPKAVPTQASFIKVGREYVITASGGVLLDPWKVISQTVVDPAVGSVYRQGQP